MSTLVAVCAHFEPEYRRALESAELAGLELASFPAACGRPPLSADEVRALCERQGVACPVKLLGSACCAGLKSGGGLAVERLNQCFYLVAPPALVDHLLSSGAYLVTPGWLVDWRAHLARMGIDEATAPLIFGESARRVVLLDTGAVPGSAQRLRELSEYVRLPCEVLPVGLDYVRASLSRLAAQRRVEAERAESLAAVALAHQRSAEFAAAFDLLGTLTEIAGEEETLERALQVFAMLFAPREALAVSLARGVPVLAVAEPASGEQDPAAAWARLQAGGIAPAVWSDGFVLPLRHLGELLGVIRVEGVAAPDHTERDFTLAQTIAGICGLAISNARKYDAIESAERKLRAGEARLRLLADTASRLLASEAPEEMMGELGREVMKHLGCDAFVGFLRDGRTGRLRLGGHAGLDESEACALAAPEVPDCSALTGRSVTACDRSDMRPSCVSRLAGFGMRALSCHPVVARGEVMGTLTFASRAPRSFTREELSLMATFADQIAMALERSGALAEAKAANARLLENDRRKNEFLAMLSHELRNPLAPIRNSVYVLEHAMPGGPQGKRALRIIDRQAAHMARLIDDLLDVTRISRGKTRLQRERVVLNDILQGAAEDHRQAFEQARVSLSVRAPAEPLYANADPTRLLQIVGNLLSNAAKFTPEGGRAELTLRRAGEGVAEIQVRDTGTGIDPALLKEVFEPFVQADTTLDRSRGGLGLGLALVKGLVELHGGSVEASSEGPGKGTLFTVRLPLAAETPEGPRAPGAVAPGACRRVLIIEDSPDAAESLKEALQLAGHRVEVAASGAEGLSRARQFAPDVILCDLGLPTMDGYQVARALRADPAVRPSLLLALSGYAAAEDVERAHFAGFDRHLAKPPDLQLLQRLIAGTPAREPADGPAPGGSHSSVQPP